MTAVGWLLSWPITAFVEMAGWFGWYREQPRVDEEWARGARRAREVRLAENAADRQVLDLTDLFVLEGERARFEAETSTEPVAVWAAHSGLKNINSHPGSSKENGR